MGLWNWSECGVFTAGLPKVLPHCVHIGAASNFVRFWWKCYLTCKTGLWIRSSVLLLTCLGVLTHPQTHKCPSKQRPNDELTVILKYNNVVEWTRQEGETCLETHALLDYIPPHWCSADDLATVLARTSCLGNKLQAQYVQQWVIALPTTALCWRQSQQARWNTLHSSAAGKLQSRYEPGRPEATLKPQRQPDLNRADTAACCHFVGSELWLCDISLCVKFKCGTTAVRRSNSAAMLKIILQNADWPEEQICALPLLTPSVCPRFSY